MLRVNAHRAYMPQRGDRTAAKKVAPAGGETGGAQKSLCKDLEPLPTSQPTYQRPLTLSTPGQPTPCGAIPHQGDGSVWCTRPEGHAGLHAGQDGAIFRRRTPRLRVIAGLFVSPTSPPRRQGAR